MIYFQLMRVKIKRFDKTIPLPEYKTEGAAGFDCYARETVTIKPYEIGYISLNIAIEIPKGYWIILAARGSTHKLGLLPANGIGVGDWDFRGENDEYKFPVLNFTDKDVTVERGTRIAQMIIVKHQKTEFEEVKKLHNKDRGGFGSTGKK